MHDANVVIGEFAMHLRHIVFGHMARGAIVIADGAGRRFFS